MTAFRPDDRHGTQMSKEAKNRLTDGSENNSSGKRDKPGVAEAPLLSEFEGKIGRHLRRYYSVRLADPLPEKFTELLDRLAKLSG
jgi:hypothetical protein